MKRKMIALLTVIVITTSAFADDVNYKVMNSFNHAFTEAKNVQWKLTKEYAKANFEIDGEHKVAVFNYDGELLAVSKKVDFNRLPQKAVSLISKKYPYPPYKLMECVELTDADDKTNFYVSFETEKEKLVLQVTPEGWVKEFSKKNK